MKTLVILSHFGYDNQVKKLEEECKELIEALKNKDIGNITEEAADVNNVVSQFLKYYKIQDPNIFENCEKIGDEKEDRTLERIKTGYYTTENKLAEAVCRQKEVISDVLGEASE